MVFATERVIDNAHEDAIWGMCWTKRTNKIITGSLDDSVKVWSGTDYSPLVTLDGHQLGVLSVDANASGTIASSSSLDSRLILWDLPNNVPLRTFHPSAAESYRCALSPDGKALATGTHNGQVHVWGVETGEKERAFEATGRKFVFGVAWSPDSTRLACSLDTGPIVIFDVSTGKSISTQSGHSMTCRDLKFTHDGRTLLTASDDGRIGIWDVGKAAGMVGKMEGHAGWVVGVDVGAEGRVASCSTDKRVKIWDLGARQCLHTFDNHTDQVWAVAFSEDGTKLASGGDSRQIIVYETKG